jgi:hypothetical protein
LFSSGLYSNVYFTQGKTVTVNNETYVIAYRVNSQGEEVKLQTMLENVFSMATPDCANLTEKLTPETSLTLSLLNLRTIGSLNNIRPVNREEELTAAKKAYQEAKAACEQSQLESTPPSH